MRTVLFLGFISFFYVSVAQKAHYLSSVKLDSKLAEASGLVVASDSSFYAINDGGNSSVVYEINRLGRIIRQIKILAPNTDWEDLSLDEKGNLYIGDIGNNLNNRRNLVLLKIPKAQLSKSEITPIRYSFSYEDQKLFPPAKKDFHYDCEAFIVRNDSAFLFTKNRTEPFDGQLKMYCLALGNSTAKLWNEIKLCDYGWYACSATSADFNFLTKELYILSYNSILRFKKVAFTKNEPLKFESVKIGKLEQFESICIVKNKFIYICSEVQKLIGGGNLHKLIWND